MARQMGWTWAALGILLVLVFGGTALMMATMKSGIAQKSRTRVMQASADDARAIFVAVRTYRESFGRIPVSQRRAVWTRAHGLDATLSGLIGYPGPKGHPRFDFYLEPSGAVSAFANGEDPGLQAVGMAILLDPNGTMTTTRGMRP